MQLLQSSWSEVSETTVKNCFRKAAISEEVAEGAINEQDDPFKDLLTDELEDSINEFRERFPEEVPTELNAAILLDIDEELSTNGGKPSDADILAEIRGEIVDDEEADDVLEVEDEPPVCPTSLEVDKALEVLQQLTLFSEKGNEMREVVEKVNAYAQREIMKRRKQKPSTITSIKFKFYFVFCDAKRILELYKNPSCCCLLVCLFCCFVQEHTVRSINCSYSGENKALLRFLQKNSYNSNFL